MPATAAFFRLGARAPCLRSQLSLYGAAIRPRTANHGRPTNTIPSLAALARFYADFPSHTVITMPALSPTMTAGGIGKWQKNSGDSLSPGDVLVEIETDKAQMDFELQEEGVLAKILKEEGLKDVAVGTPIAVMVEDASDVAAFDKFTVDDAGGDKTPPKKEPGQETADASEPPDSGSGTAPPGGKAAKSEPKAQESDSTGARLETSLERLEREPSISARARRYALEKGIPAYTIKGTGRGGQVTLEDVEKYKPSGGPSGGPAAAMGPAYEDIPASSMRKTIATRLTQSMQQNPHYFVTSKLSVTKLLQLRQALNSSADGAFKLSVNDLVIKAIALAARAVPAANSSWREDGSNVIIRQHNSVDVSVAVATPTGLMTPIVRGADTLGLKAISSTVKDLGKRARDGKLKPEEYQGGTITISNMGMNDAVDSFTAVINPPQAAILAIGTVKKAAIPGESLEEGGEPSVQWDDQMTITGSFDHKVVDGAVAGEYMKELKKIVENPLQLSL